MEGRNSVFLRLKPPCVALSEAALTLNGPRGDVRRVTETLGALKSTLLSITNSEPDALDVKLADYTFFPISNALKLSQRLPAQSLEFALQCIERLISQGWREQLQPQLAAQLVILCTLLAEKDPQGLSFSTSTDDLRASAFSCLFSIFSVLGSSAQCKAALTNEAGFPQLGHTISVLLGGIEDGASPEVQIAATRALDGFATNVRDRELYASFLPGIVSKLSRILTPDTRQRRNRKVLIGCLDILAQLLRHTLNDQVFSDSLEKSDHGPTSSSAGKQRKSIIDAEWKKTAASQLQLAVDTISRLRNHSAEDVQHALGSFCLVLLRECRATLSNISSMALKTLLAICAQHSESGFQDQLEVLAREQPDNRRPSFVGLLQNTLYDWLESLPTLMQGPDNPAKTSRMQQIGIAHGLLSQSNTDTSAIDRIVAQVARDSVVLTIADGQKSAHGTSFASAIQSLDLVGLRGERRLTSFSNPLIKYRGQEEIIGGIESLLKAVTRPRSSIFLNEFSRAFDNSENDFRIASFWLLLTTLQETLQRNDGVDSMLVFEDDSGSIRQEHLEYLYDKALAILNANPDEETDSRLTALALQTLALRAETAGKDFRFELVDALYPVLHALATPNEQLQEDSIAALNTFASACEYSSVEDLLVQNSDYLTNAVALKLNNFDVSPQAPQVLLMMLRLAGPSLLPYMEDTVESIFSALEDYHGYPVLVELLFRVLGVMAEEGVKAPQLAITDVPPEESAVLQQEKWQPVSVTALAQKLRERAEDERNAGSSIENQDRPESHPEKPWKSILEEDDADADDTDNVDADGPNANSDNTQMQDVESPPPAPKTYGLLFKITELTQHFLPAASPTLRTSLLGLIKTTTPAIAKHEDSFLPLINTLWPEIVSRLDDEEPYVVASTLEIVGILCEHAGDFMRTRITQLWIRLLDIYSSTSREILRLETSQKPSKSSLEQGSKAVIVRTTSLIRAVEKMEAHPADYADTMNRQLWSALTKSLTTIVAHISLSPEMFDEALQMLVPVLRDPAVRDVLERENADAVWLAELKSGRRERPRIPDCEVASGWQSAAITR